MSAEKILFVTDYLPDDKNSVSDILQVMIEKIQSKNNVLILYNDSLSGEEIDLSNEGNLKIYRGNSSDRSSKTNSYRSEPSLSDRILRKSLCFIKREERYTRYRKYKNIKNIIKKESPDLVIWFIFSPSEKCYKICNEIGVKCAFVLYDTYISRPGMTKSQKEKVYKTESYLINHSSGYFIPGFFFDDYLKQYHSEKMYSYDLPLVIEKKLVKKAYENKTDRYDFLYLGQIQSFRNSERINDIFRQLNLKLDVFTWQDIKSDNQFSVHPAVAGNELLQTVADSKFLVAFDNSAPYAHYLPSKVYLYVSFTKPIIAFGDNEQSALKDFFKDYNMFYYQNINEPFDGLIDFIQNTSKNEFDDELYARYSRFTPYEAGNKLAQKIIGSI